MLIGIIIAVLLILLVGITKIKGRYTLGFVTAFFSIVLLLLSLMLYITKMTVYRYFFQIEFIIYRFISNIKISFYDIKWILIIAVVIFQLAMVLVTVRDVYTARQGVTRRYFVLYAVLISLCMFLVWGGIFGVKKAIERFRLNREKTGEYIDKAFDDDEDML